MNPLGKLFSFLAFSLFSSMLNASSLEESIGSAVDRLSAHLLSSTAETTLHLWERDMSPVKYSSMLEDCFSYERNDSAKNRLIKILHENSSPDSNAMLTSQRDVAITFHCSHALAASSFKGLSFSSRPVQASDIEAMNTSVLLNECHGVHRKGIRGELKKGIVAATKFQLTMQGASNVTMEHVAFSYAALCAASIKAAGTVVAISVSPMQ